MRTTEPGEGSAMGTRGICSVVVLALGIGLLVLVVPALPVTATPPAPWAALKDVTAAIRPQTSGGSLRCSHWH